MVTWSINQLDLMLINHRWAYQLRRMQTIVSKVNLVICEVSGLQRTCEFNAAGENSSFIFTVGVKSVPRYHFKLAYSVLQMAVKEVFEAHFQKWRNKPF